MIAFQQSYRVTSLIVFITNWEVFFMKLNYDLKHVMQKLGIETLRKHQIKPIHSILDGQDTLIIAPTGSG